MMNRLVSRTAVVLAVLAALAGAEAAAQQHPNLQRGFAAERVYQYSEIDRVDPLTGNLLLEIPLGGRYPLGGQLAYGLTLSYNSKAWDFEEVWYLGQAYNRALPSRRSNAGLGWLLSWGRLISPSDPSNDSNGFWIYESPDGADHVLYASLHGEGDGSTPGELTTWYSRDSTYLRMRDLGSGVRELDFPDGTIHRFRSDGKITQIRDRFGNSATVDYPTTTTTRLVDQHGRTQTITFVSRLIDGEWRLFVDRVVVSAFAGATATYQLVYSDTSVERGDSCVAYPYPFSSTHVTVPLLTRVDVQTDGSSFQMAYYVDNADGSCREGAIQRITLPTLGRIDWTYQQYRLPTEGCQNWVAARRSPGVKTKRTLDAGGTQLGVWEYQLGWTAGFVLYPECTTDAGYWPPWEENTTTIVTPLKDRIVHAFSVWPELLVSPNGFLRTEFGLPLTRFQADATGTRFLSSQVYDCDAAGGSCVLERSSYMAYERDALLEPGFAGAIDANRRLSSSRTVFHDDGGRYADTTSSNFDGLGHYRQVSDSGNLPPSTSRTVFTNYNPTRGTYPGSFVMPTPATAWVLDTFSHQDATEGSVTARTEACFDSANGFLLRTRTLKSGTTQGAQDMIAAFTRDAQGNRIREQHYGGDLQSLGTGNLCTLSLPGDSLRIDHGYQFGVLASSQYFTASGAAMSFKSVDRDIDGSTGLIAAERDSAGIATTYEYDALGRLTWEKPAAGHDGWTEYAYTRATSTGALAKVAVRQRNNGSKTATIAAQGEYWFDALGRVWQERQLMPNGTWSAIETLYDAAGYKASVSELGNTAKKTQLLFYDPFGRPERIRPADGSAHDILFTYLGARLVERRTKVGTALDAQGNVTETYYTVAIERYDRHGRLYQLVEPSGASGANVTTTYTYDVGNRLTRVSTPGSGVTQVRTFSYDNRGFLVAEKHPEKGTGTCNAGGDHVCYSSYNARGLAGRKRDGASDLTFSYDRAERLTQVKETGLLGSVLKTFTYATANGTSNWKNGKLEAASRFNHVTLGGSPYTVEVRESYVYGGRGGRPSSRVTQNFINGSLSDGFSQTWTWGHLGEVTARGYPQCTGCAVPAARTVGFTYRNGFLTAVQGYTGTVAGQTTGTGLTYHPNGLVHQVAHGNGVTWTQANDPNMMRRPASFATSGAITPAGAVADWSTGSYLYDGSGHVVKAGTATFLYDPVGRLTSGTIYTGLTGGGTQRQQTYGYDSFGNILTIGGTSARNTPTSAATNRLTGGTYDDAGNLTWWNGNSYQYDRFHQVLRVVTGTQEWIHLYTADDERLWSYQVTGGAINRWTIRDLDGRVLREYVYDRPTATWRVERDHAYRGTTLLAADTPTGRIHYHPDHLGTPRLITNASRHQLAYHVYYPFGEEATAFNQDGERMKFTGHERDLHDPAGAGDDLDYMHARYYNPQLGRFLSFDAAGRSAKPGAPQTWNRYSYVAGNPLKYVDPDGHERAAVMQDVMVNQLLRGEISREDYLETIRNPGPAAVVAAGVAATMAAPLLGGGALAAGLRTGLSELAFNASAALATRGLLVRTAPAVTSPALQKVVNELFKASDRFAGGTAGALRVEAATGRMLSRSPVGHLQAGLERLGRLGRALETGGLGPRDVQTALRLERDLKNALQLAMRRRGFSAEEITTALSTHRIPK